MYGNVMIRKHPAQTSSGSTQTEGNTENRRVVTFQPKYRKRRGERYPEFPVSIREGRHDRRVRKENLQDKKISPEESMVKKTHEGNAEERYQELAGRFAIPADIAL